MMHPIPPNHSFQNFKLTIRKKKCSSLILEQVALLFTVPYGTLGMQKGVGLS